MNILFAAVIVLTSGEVVDLSDKVTDRIEVNLVRECKGDFDPSINWAAFHELRQRGVVPEFSMERCLEWGIIPPWTKKEEGEG
ncbi:hypothetical protein [Kiloniella antarctica]|uniref:Uncharacterized protein n=1 Tax=Kiloniella antarctica TaxID=1550907 RepID=A0ABW5BM66_9PROT